MRQEKTNHSSSETQLDRDETDSHRNVPTPDPACLYGLVGEVAKAGSKGNESNPFAIALNFTAYLSCAIGRGTFLQIGNTEHHSRVFSLHVGRSGRGRKGDSLALVIKIDLPGDIRSR
jgi:hypothetical protein